MSAKHKSAAARKRVLRQIELSWAEHPDWGIGRLISSAASIARGELRRNPRDIPDREIMSGLRALIPDEDEAKR